MRLMPWSWAVGVVLAGIALGWLVLYELGIRECRRDMADVLAQQCSGPLDSWVLPLAFLAALVLVAIGIWRLVPPPRY